MSAIIIIVGHLCAYVWSIFRWKCHEKGLRVEMWKQIGKKWKIYKKDTIEGEETKHEERRELRRKREVFRGITKQKQGGLCACHYWNSQQGSERERKRDKQLQRRTRKKSLGGVITNNIIVNFGNIYILLVQLGRHTLILYLNIMVVLMCSSWRLSIFQKSLMQKVNCSLYIKYMGMHTLFIFLYKTHPCAESSWVQKKYI